EVGQVADPGRRIARAVQEPGRPAGRHRAAEGQGPGCGPAVREHALSADPPRFRRSARRETAASRRNRGTTPARHCETEHVEGGFAAWLSLATVVALILIDLAVRITALIVVPRNRRPQTAMAWLLAIFFIPYVGILFFLLFGSARRPRNR